MVQIRSAKLSDAKAIYTIWANGWRYAYKNILSEEALERFIGDDVVQDRIKTFPNYLRSSKSKCDVYFVAVDGDKVVGFVNGGSIQSKECGTDKELHGMYIDTNYIGKGVGKLLFLTFVYEMRKRKAKTFGLMCFSDNPSIEFYKKMGGVVTIERPSSEKFENTMGSFLEFKIEDVLNKAGYDMMIMFPINKNALVPNMKLALTQNKKVFIWFSQFPFKNEKALEHATRGLCHRLNIARACAMNVFDAYRPDRKGLPSTKEVIEMTINFQSFVFNIYGCLDNLAWIWASESGFQHKNVFEIQFSSEKNKSGLLNTLSQDFQKYWKSISDKLKHLKELRDALAHRIPLSVPPYVALPEKMQECAPLEDELQQANLRGDVDRHKEINKKLEELTFFEPICMHSPMESSSAYCLWMECIGGLGLITDICEKLIPEIKQKTSVDTTELDKIIKDLEQNKQLNNLT